MRLLVLWFLASALLFNWAVSVSDEVLELIFSFASGVTLTTGIFSVYQKK